MKVQMVTKEAKFTKQYKRAWFVVALIMAPICIPIGLWLWVSEKLEKAQSYMIRVIQRLSWLICYWVGVEGFFYKDIPEDDE